MDTLKITTMLEYILVENSDEGILKAILIKTRQMFDIQWVVGAVEDRQYRPLRQGIKKRQMFDTQWEVGR
ncbi:hypothetical protein Unana1_02268 [Umbelopsis nana]